MFKSRKGITLISLVVTIIILLILSMIVIGIVVNNDGVIERAKSSDSATKMVNLKEQIEIWKMNTRLANERGKEPETIDNFLNRLKSENLLTDQDISKINEKINVGIYVVEINGEILNFSLESVESVYKNIKVGDIIYYDPTAGVTDSTKLVYTSPKGSSLASGDTSNISGNGSNAQKFQATSDDCKWIVIKNEFGQLTLISENVKNPIEGGAADGKFKIQGQTGYLYAEQELNNICSIYGYGKGTSSGADYIYTPKIGSPDVTGDLQNANIIASAARSITIDDIEEITEIRTRNQKIDLTGSFMGSSYWSGDENEIDLYYFFENFLKNSSEIEYWPLTDIQIPKLSRNRNNN